MDVRISLVFALGLIALQDGLMRGQGLPPNRPRYVLTGVVTDSGRTPIVAAEVGLVQADSVLRKVRTDTVGRFEFGELLPGGGRIIVRRLGYQPLSLDVRIRPDGQPASLTAVLTPIALSLEQVLVTERMDELPGRLREFYERRQTNSFGHFIEREQIEQSHARHLSEVLRSIPGVTLSASRRFGNIVRIRGCRPLVWVDGVRLPAAELDEAVTSPNDVAAIEVYSSMAGIPARYFDRSNPCGTVLVWTRGE